MQDFKKDLINHFDKSKLMTELEKAGKFDDKLIEKFKKEFKEYVAGYIAALPNYKAEKYGDIKELK